jgi:hypothetical protein
MCVLFRDQARKADSGSRSGISFPRRVRRLVGFGLLFGFHVQFAVTVSLFFFFATVNWSPSTLFSVFSPLVLFCYVAIPSRHFSMLCFDSEVSSLGLVWF